ncbi:MAG: GGDEF domain-containing protein, partial [Sphingomonas sp.]
MRDAQGAQQVSTEDLFDQIGRFLRKHRLRPDPSHYAFAHAVLSAPDGPLAAQVAQLTEGGVRLLRRDIEALGGQVTEPSAVVDHDGPCDPAQREGQADRLVAETQEYVDGFATIMHSIHAETRGFGHDLAESAAAITTSPGLAEIDEITRITTAMIGRIRESEVRLAKAKHET